MSDSSPPNQLRSPTPHTMGDSSSAEVFHKVKSIRFLGRPTHIVLQSDNGPCPLLAICNVLLLRNHLSLSPAELFEVPQSKLLHLVAERILDSNSKLDGKDAQYVENLHQIIADAIDLLPCLTTGVDVNMKFRRIDEFEYTRECAIFDLLDIPLYHGWLVDPEDYDTAKAIGSKSYNTITGELVKLQETNQKGKGQIEEVSVDSVGATTTTLRVHRPDLSKNEALNNSAWASSERTTIGKGDAEEEAELLRILELSKTESREQDLMHQIICASTDSADNPQKNQPFEEVDAERSTSGASADSVPGLDVDVSKFESCPTEDPVIKTQHPASTQLESDLQVLLTPETSLNEETYKELTTENSTLMSPNGDSSSKNAQNSFETESPTSTLESSEFMLESPTAVCEDPEPVYEGQVTVGKPFDESSLDVSDLSSVEGMTQKDGDLVNKFLQSNASQLTYHGLFSLQNELQEKKLCAFFRNNHFSTAFKFEGALYMLTTDHGYLDAPGIVWEQLNDISGASVFCDSNFKEFMPESQANTSWVQQNTLVERNQDYLPSTGNFTQDFLSDSASDYLPSTENFTRDFSAYDSDREYARLLQDQEDEQQQHHQQQQQLLQQRHATPQPQSDGRSRLVTSPQTPGRNARTSLEQEKKPKGDQCSIM